MVCGFMYARMKKPRLILGGFLFVNESNMFYSCQNNLQQHCLLEDIFLCKSLRLSQYTVLLYHFFSQNCKNDCKIKALFVKCEI